MDGSTIPYYVVEERKKLNRCIEEAPNDYEKEIYRAIRNMPEIGRASCRERV